MTPFKVSFFFFFFHFGGEARLAEHKYFYICPDFVMAFECLREKKKNPDSICELKGWITAALQIHPRLESTMSPRRCLWQEVEANHGNIHRTRLGRDGALFG
jgi:hypothetical protein